MLGRAKTLMKGWVAPPPAVVVAFNVACANGHRLRGERTEGYQALRCPSCGEAVFVLPRSPLPEPPVPAPRRPRADVDLAAGSGVAASDDAPHALVAPPSWAATQDGLPPPAPPGDDVAEIDWVDEPAPAPSARPAAPPRPAVSSPPPVAPARPAAVIAAPRPTLREWATARRNPLMAAAAILLVTGAVAWKWRQQRLEGLPQVAEIGRTEGFKKLDAGEFFAAKKILAEAAAAVDALGGRFEGAESIRQAAREAALFTDLVPASLEALVEEGTTYPDVKGWSSHFAAIYRGRSIILETTITAAPDPAKPGSRYEDAARILVGRGTKPEAIGRVSYAGFELFDAAQPKVGAVVTFGARLAALEFDLAENAWLLTLEPDSGTFITHARALEALHWPTGVHAEEPTP